MTLLAGAAILLVGYLIKYRGWTSLVAGVGFADGASSPAVAAYAGNVTLVAGGFVILVGAVQALGLLHLVPGWLQAVAFVAAVVVVTPRLGVRPATD